MKTSSDTIGNRWWIKFTTTQTTCAPKTLIVTASYEWTKTAQSVQRLATGWTVGGSNPSGGWDFLHPSRPALRATQPPTQWVPGNHRGLSGRVVALTATPISRRGQRKNRATRILSLCAFMTSYRLKFTCILTAQLWDKYRRAQAHIHGAIKQLLLTLDISPSLKFRKKGRESPYIKNAGTCLM